MAKTIKTDKYAMDFNDFIDNIDNINKLEVPKNYIEVNKHGKFKSKLSKSKKAK